MPKYRYRRRRATRLTSTQLEYLHLVSLGRSEVEIGAQFFVTRATVSTQLGRAYSKLDVTSAAQAVLVACFEGYIGPDADDPRFVREYRDSRRAKAARERERVSVSG